MRRDALIARLERYLDLTPDERRALEALGAREQRVAAGDVLMQQGQLNDYLYVVQQGWLHTASQLPTGARQILRFHYAGDLVGTSSIAWVKATYTLTAVSDCIVAALPKAEFGRLFAAQPRLGGLLYAVSAAEYVAMNDRLTSIGRMGAHERLATMLLDILARLRVTAGGVVDSFDLPLTQQDIGDAVGLTKVHVSRTLGAMEKAGEIVRNGRRMRVLDEAGMIAATGFIDRYDVVQTDWLPAAA